MKAFNHDLIRIIVFDIFTKAVPGSSPEDAPRDKSSLAGMQDNPSSDCKDRSCVRAALVVPSASVFRRRVCAPRSSWKRSSGGNEAFQLR